MERSDRERSELGDLQHSSASAKSPSERSEDEDCSMFGGDSDDSWDDYDESMLEYFPSPPREVSSAKRPKLASSDKGNAIFTFSVRWSKPESMSVDEFSAKYKDLQNALAEHIGAKGHYMFQRELTLPDNHHYQGMINRTVKIRLLQFAAVLREEFPGIHLGPASAAGRQALRDYCMKSDTRQAGPWADRRIVPKYEGADLPKEWYQWQQYFIELFQQKADVRTIHVVVDPLGGQGKSMLAKYFAWKKLAQYLTFSDANNLVYSVVERGAMPAYVFDLPRTKSKKVSMDEIYTALEQIKNGNVYSGKYKGGELIMDPPHVVLFTNWPIDKSKMSDDRWKVYNIVDNQLVQV